MKLSAVDTEELKMMIFGKKLGKGSYRTVYVSQINDAFVIKYEHKAYNYCNVKEWQIWQAVKEYSELAKWFAPCDDISPAGIFLTQKRTLPLDKLPELVPDFLEDVVLRNCGMLDGRPVLHDYGNNALLSRGVREWKLVPVGMCGPDAQFPSQASKPSAEKCA